MKNIAGFFSGVNFPFLDKIKGTNDYNTLNNTDDNKIIIACCIFVKKLKEISNLLTIY